MYLKRIFISAGVDCAKSASATSETGLSQMQNTPPNRILFSTWNLVTAQAKQGPIIRSPATTWEPATNQRSCHKPENLLQTRDPATNQRSCYKPEILLQTRDPATNQRSCYKTEDLLQTGDHATQQHCYLSKSCLASKNHHQKDSHISENLLSVNKPTTHQEPSYPPIWSEILSHY